MELGRRVADGEALDRRVDATEAVKVAELPLLASAVLD